MCTANINYPAGSKIKFAEEKQRYTVRAASERFLICTKPYNPKRTVIYTVVDLVENIRGTENLIFGRGAETDEQCAEMLARLEGFDTPTEISRRNRVRLNIESSSAT